MFEVPDHMLIHPERTVHCRECGEEMLFLYPFPDVLPDLCEECEKCEEQEEEE